MPASPSKAFQYDGTTTEGCQLSHHIISEPEALCLVLGRDFLFFAASFWNIGDVV